MKLAAFLFALAFLSSTALGAVSLAPSTVNKTCVQDSDCLPANYNPVRSCTTQYRCLENHCAKVEISCDVGSCALCKTDGICTSDECEICQDCLGGAPVVQVQPETNIPSAFADVVFVLDTSDSMEPVWQEVCDELALFINEVTARDIDLNFQIYGLSTTNAIISSKSCYKGAAKLDNSLLKIPEGAKTQWFPSNDCLADTGGAKDTVCEAWGNGAWYAVEHPFVDGSSWRDNAEHLVIVFADSDPSGGRHGPDSFEGFRTASCGANSGSLSCADPDSEMAVAQGLIDSAQRANAQLFFFHKPDVRQKDDFGSSPCLSWNLSTCLEYNHNDYFPSANDLRNPNNNDALALLLQVAGKTGEYVEATRYDSGEAVDSVTQAVLSVFGGASRPVLFERLCRADENPFEDNCISFDVLSLTLEDANIVVDDQNYPITDSNEPISIEIIPTPDQNETIIEIIVDENKIEIIVEDENGEEIVADTNEPVEVDKKGKKLKLGKGKKEVKTLPDKAKAELLEREQHLDLQRLKIKTEKDEKSREEKIKYEAEGIEKGKLLALIPVELPVKAKLDSDSRVVESVEKPFWSLLVFTEPPSKKSPPPQAGPPRTKAN